MMRLSYQVPRNAPYNIGRPEAVETFFVMWYYTRDPKWREMGWQVFKAFERRAGTPSGWASLKDVDNLNTKLDDKMESFVRSRVGQPRQSTTNQHGSTPHTL